MIAAMTTSIPESPGSVMQLDYRFRWLRDQLFHRAGAQPPWRDARTMEAYLALHREHHRESRRAVRRSATLMAFRRGAARRASHRVAAWLSFHAPRSVSATRLISRYNIDVYGAVILAATQADLRRAPGSSWRQTTLFECLEGLGERRTPVRPARLGTVGIPRACCCAYFSSVMCWAGCDRLARTSTSHPPRRSGQLLARAR